jgi:hypothetical protein
MIDTQIDIDRPTVGRAYKKRGGFPAGSLAARQITGEQRRHQSFCQGSLCCLECLFHGVDDLGTYKPVPLDREARIGVHPRPNRALRFVPGVSSGSSVDADQRHLPCLRTFAIEIVVFR